MNEWMKYLKKTMLRNTLHFFKCFSFCIELHQHIEADN